MHGEPAPGGKLDLKKGWLALIIIEIFYLKQVE